MSTEKICFPTDKCKKYLCFILGDICMYPVANSTVSVTLHSKKKSKAYLAGGLRLVTVRPAACPEASVHLPPHVWSGLLVPVVLQQRVGGSGRESQSEILYKLNSSTESIWLHVEVDDDFSTSTTKRCGDGEDEPPHQPRCLHRAAGFGCSLNEKPVARCPVFHKLLFITHPPRTHTVDVTLPRLFHHFL